MRSLSLFILYALNTFSLGAQLSDNYVKNQLIIQFKESLQVDHSNLKFYRSDLDDLNTKFELEAIKLTGHVDKQDTYLLVFKNDIVVSDLIEAYEKIEFVEFVEPNFIGTGAGQKSLSAATPNDAYFFRQYGLHNDGTFSLSPSKPDADIDMDNAWEIEKGDSNIVVAVLDAGIKLDHPEFTGRLWDNSNESLNGIDDDNNSYVDDKVGWDFANSDNDPVDDNGHGTNVTGIIAANANNSIGYVGVDWNCKIMTCKVLDQNNNGFYSWWTEAIYYAVDNGARVINMSLGGPSYSQTMKQALDYAYTSGVVVIASMMNFDDSTVYYPAGYQNTIAVGATTSEDKRASPFFWSPSSGSSYGNHIDVTAPGEYIYGLSHLSNVNYNFYWGGTSQAAPIVSGISALLLAQDSNRTPEDIRAILRSTAEDQVGDPAEDIPGFDIYYGHGRVNAHQALLHNSMTLEELNSLQLTVFPNPASTIIYVKDVPKHLKIVVTNSIGNVIGQVRPTPNEQLTKIDVSDLPSGLYIVLIKDRIGNIVSSGRIIKN